MSREYTGQPMSAADVLRATRELIAEPEAWTQNANARLSSGERCLSSDPGATCWCLFGAIARAAPTAASASEAMSAVERRLRVSIFAWNDARGRTHDDVLILLSDVIAAEEEAPDVA